MVIVSDFTEVPDSEDEPLSSSPLASTSVVDKLCASACGTYQDAQDPLQRIPSSHQDHAETAQAAVSAVNERHDGLGGDLANSSFNVNNSTFGLIDESRDTSTHPQHHTAFPSCDTSLGPSPYAVDTAALSIEVTADASGENAKDQNPAAMLETDEAHIVCSGKQSDSARSSIQTRVGDDEATTINLTMEPKDILEPGAYPEQHTGKENVIHPVTSKIEPSEQIILEIGGVTTPLKSTSGNVPIARPGSMIIGPDTTETSPKARETAPIAISTQARETAYDLEVHAGPDTSASTSKSFVDSYVDPLVGESNGGTPKGSFKNSTVPITSPYPSSHAVGQSGSAPAISSPREPQNDLTQDSSTMPAPSTKPKTQQEVTLAELKAQKAAMLASLVTLPAIQVLIEEQISFDADKGGLDDGNEPTEADIMQAANKLVKHHIKLLHEYNELKDVGQGLMGLIADQRGVRIVEVQEEFGIDAQD